MSQTTTEDIDGCGGVRIIVTTIAQEIDAGGQDLVHVAHRREGRLAIIIPNSTAVTADGHGRDRRLAREEERGRRRRNERRGNGIVIETRVPAKRRAAVLKSQQILQRRRRKGEEAIMAAKEGELLLNRQRGTIYLAFLR